MPEVQNSHSVCELHTYLLWNNLERLAIVVEAKQEGRTFGCDRGLLLRTRGLNLATACCQIQRRV